MPRKLPKHIFNLLLLLGGFFFLAFVAKIVLTDPSYYKFGYYRADAVPEIAAGTPLYQGSAYCQTCHEERLVDWSTGAHRTVQCEVCHGAQRDCPVEGISRIPADTIKLCTTCHEAMPARPASHPQIDLAEHPFPDEETPQCHTCHDPHFPGDGIADEEAPDTETQADLTVGVPDTLPDLAKKCAKCHGKQGEGLKKNPALAGMESAVFIERMNLYRSGDRESKKMTKYAKRLSDKEIVELAEYYESLPVKPPE